MIESVKKPTDDKLLIGAVTLIFVSFFLIILNSVGLSGNMYYPYTTRTINYSISIIVGFLVIIGTVYTNIRKTYVVFGYILCLVGAISTIAFQIFLTIINPFFSPVYGIKSYLFGSLVLIGLILHKQGNDIGRKICVYIGVLDLLFQFFPLLSMGLIYALIYVLRGGFLNIYIFIQCEPFLIFIGSYFLRFDFY